MSKIKKDKIKAQKIVIDSLPVLINLLNNPKFVTELEKSGRKFDISSIFKTLTDAAGWKVDMNKVFLDAKKMNKNGK